MVEIVQARREPEPEMGGGEAPGETGIRQLSFCFIIHGVHK